MPRRSPSCSWSARTERRRAAPQRPRPARQRPDPRRDAGRASRSDLWVPLWMMAVVGTFAYNFPVLLPLFAKFVWHGERDDLRALTCSMAAGSVIGGLFSAAPWPREPAAAGRRVGDVRRLIALVAAAADPASSRWCAAATGIASITFMASCNSSLQLAAEGPLRGRVMALFGIVFLGSTPIGAPIVGWVSRRQARAGGWRSGRRRMATAAVAAATCIAARAICVTPRPRAVGGGAGRHAGRRVGIPSPEICSRHEVVAGIARRRWPDGRAADDARHRRRPGRVTGCPPCDGC